MNDELRSLYRAAKKYVYLRNAGQALAAVGTSIVFTKGAIRRKQEDEKEVELTFTFSDALSAFVGIKSKTFNLPQNLTMQAVKEELQTAAAPAPAKDGAAPVDSMAVNMAPVAAVVK